MLQSLMTGYLSRSKRKRASIKKLLNVTKKVAGYSKKILDICTRVC